MPAPDRMFLICILMSLIAASVMSGLIAGTLAVTMIMQN